MSGCLEFLKCLLCCEEEHEEDVFEVLGSRSGRNSLDVKSVERISDRLRSSNNCSYAPIYSDDPPRSSPALPKASSKFLSPSSIPTPTRPKPQTSSSNQSQSLRIPATVSSRGHSLFPPAPSTTSSKPSCQATTLSSTSSPSPPPPSTSSSKSSHQAPTPALHSSPSPKTLPSSLQPAISACKPSPSSPKPLPSTLQPAISASKPSPSSPTYSDDPPRSSPTSPQSSPSPMYSDDPPRSSSASPQSSSKFLSPSSIPTPTRLKPQTSSSNQSQSLLIPATASSRGASLFPPAPSTTSSKPSCQATTLSFTSSPLPPPPSTSSSKSSHQAPAPAFHSSPSPKPLPSSLKPAISASKPSPSPPEAFPSSMGPCSSSSKQSPSFKPTLSLASPNLINEKTKVSHMWVQKGLSPIYAIPKGIEDLISRDKVPEVLEKPLPSSLQPAISASKPSPSSPIYSDDPPRSSPALPQSSSKFLSPASTPTPTKPKPQTSSSNQSQSLRIPATVSSRGPSLFPPAPSTTSSKPSHQATTLSFTSSPLPPPPSTSSSKSSHQAPAPAPAFHSSPSPKPLPSLLKPAISTSKPLPSSPQASPSSLRPSSSSSKQPPSFKPTLSLAPPNLINEQTKVSYMAVQKGLSPLYAIPKDIEDLIRRDKVPEVLDKPLSPSTYKDYFAALLYAEDFYIEKWSEFKLENITLKLQDAEIIKKSSRNEYFSETYEKDDKTFVEFEIDSCRERRPFLLSRDFVFARPSGQKSEPYQGIIYRVVKSTRILVEFGEDFLLQHHSTHKYDVSFSFNRVCLKRAHQAIKAASDPLFRIFLFPDHVPRKIIPTSTLLHFGNHKLDVSQSPAVREILSFQGPPPYLVEGSLCSEKYSKQLSRTGLVVQEAVQQIYRRSSKHRILICAPINRTCDALMQGLKNDIPQLDMFRANAAFREIDGVPIDILPSCVYEGECFACPSLQQLRKFRVILSTFVSSFRLHNEGIAAGHFSHIFLVDASSATEPEAMVALANLAGENTAVIVTGAPGNRSGWVRSDIARGGGLRTSYFERLRDGKPESKPIDTYSHASFSYDYD